ncbi:ParB/RepB/Spo0J family partition protein [Adlercreutzia caecimuris]|uniref:ParB-like partition protein n=1 Tax=Adlercreutzia caecimuris B7 TaxID=1235794 RepID=R9KUX6_9ACTN|nr:ParB/RepB/Spo0J family partition protein [Adlercreutzia caecimuris]EOS50339.1 ParB-like partition protein [Adlercreutzia caecimuris B7]
MARKRAPIELPTVDELFTSQSERDNATLEGVTEIQLALIDPFPGHPFHVKDDEEMERLAESIAENGVLVPLTVRASGTERYELVSGHRRKRAAELAGIASAPCIVRSMDDDEAVIAMVDSNLQREAILPSERAFAYSMRLEAMKHQGLRTDLTSAQVAQKSSGRWSRDILAEELGVSKDKVQRFIRLTHLIPELLALVDEGRMKMLPAVEVSYLSQEEQTWLFDAMGAQACTPSHAQAVKMKRYSKEGSLTSALVRSIMEEEKPNQVEQFKIPRKSIARFFRPSATRDEIESRIVRALELLEQAEARRGRQGGA